MRTTEIRLIPAHAQSDYDSYYVVELYENDEYVSTVECKGKSLHWCRSISDNWASGVISIDKIQMGFTSR
jgi:hypothetical protein